MKKKRYYIIVIVLFILGSSYRFVQLNKDIWGKELYTEVDYGSTFNINGVNFEVEKFETLDNIDELESTDLKFSINLYKHGEITSKGFNKQFPTDYATSIILNITDQKGILVVNYVIDFKSYGKDNSSFIEIQRGQRVIGDEKENLNLTFRVEKNIMEGIKNNIYSAKLVFPKDDKDLEFNFMDINLDQMRGI